MIIQNGTIEVRHKLGGGIDPETGHPVDGERHWGCPLPCQYVPYTHDKRATTNGEHYTLASYMVYVEEQPFCVRGEQVRLRDCRGCVIGEYSVASVDYLTAVCQTRLTV